MSARCHNDHKKYCISIQADDGSHMAGLISRLLTSTLLFERKHQPLLPLRSFFTRMMGSLGLGVTLITASLFMGMAGYHVFEDMDWVNAFVNAAMILSSMGPVSPMHTNAGMWFAGFYALYSGLALMFILGIVFAPIIHRFLHHFHIDGDAD